MRSFSFHQTLASHYPRELTSRSSLRLWPIFARAHIEGRSHLAYGFGMPHTNALPSLLLEQVAPLDRNRLKTHSRKKRWLQLAETSSGNRNGRERMAR